MFLCECPTKTSQFDLNFEFSSIVSDQNYHFSLPSGPAPKQWARWAIKQESPKMQKMQNMLVFPTQHAENVQKAVTVAHFFIFLYFSFEKPTMFCMFCIFPNL